MTLHNKTMEPGIKELADQETSPAPISLGWKKMIISLAILLGVTMSCLLFVRLVLL